MIGRNRWRRVGFAFAVVALSLYAPFAWLLNIDYPWSGYRLYWLKLWPILPGFLAGAAPGPLLYGGHLPYEFEIMAATTVVLLAALTWLASRGAPSLAAAAAIALAVAVPTSFVAYAVFRA